MPSPTHRGATRRWKTPEWTELPGTFIEPIYFKTFPTDEVGKVIVNLRRGDRIKKLTLHAFDPDTAMSTLMSTAALWDYKLG